MSQPRKNDLAVLNYIGTARFCISVVLLSAYYVPLLVGIVGTGLFIYRQLHSAQPFLELRIFKNLNYTLSVLNSMLLYVVKMGVSIMIPL